MSRLNPLPILLALLLAGGLVACDSEMGRQPPPTPPDLTQPTPPDDPEDTMPPDQPQPPGPVPQDLLGQMLEEAAAIAGVSVSEVTVERSAAVTWNDGSLGCPEPGQLYTQALVDGYWVVLRAGGRELDFRATQRGDFKLCPPGQGRPPVDASHDRSRI
jgi:hypothetical protein